MLVFVSDLLVLVLDLLFTVLDPLVFVMELYKLELYKSFKFNVTETKKVHVLEYLLLSKLQLLVLLLYISPHCHYL